jgi:gamma-D-glutamyl-L-lysine dipeptidyl-peptidase
MPSIAAIALFAAALPNVVVVRPVADLYSRASEDADVVSQAIYGANAGILERKPGWLRVRTADEYTGWLPERNAVERAPYAAAGPVAEVRSLAAHIYREADVTRHAPLATVPFETRLEAVRVPPAGERWIELRLPDGRAGWIQSGDVVFDRRPLSIPASIDLARRFLGAPYTWGGVSSFGFDCSGFTQLLMRQRGVALPRDAQPQAESGVLVPVDREALQAGDLLYFGSSVHKITHTGYYIGGGKFLNATTWQTPAVRVDDLSDPHWTQLYVAARRAK